MTDFEIEIYRLINGAFKGTSHKLTLSQFLVAVGKADTPSSDKSAIATLLHDDKFQRALWQAGTLLWVGHDQKIRIVDSLAMPLRQDVGKHLCRLCLMDEDDPRELIWNRDDDDSFVHPLCQDRLQKLQRYHRREMTNE